MICLASDHGGFLYKEKLKKYLEENNIKYKDFGTSSQTRCDAIDFCVPATKEVLKNKNNKGIFICRSGHAMAIIANKFLGIRAVCCCNKKSVKSAREHNDINVLTAGADYLSFNKFKKMVEMFLSTKFLGGDYQKRIVKLQKLEKDLQK